jgi:GT2 family glycosyltransferase
LASHVSFPYEIIIVDNNSDDNSIEYLQSRFKQDFICFIPNKENRGFAKANNQAIQFCRGKYILILNPDTVLGEDVLENTYHFIDNEPLAGAIGVKMINGKGEFLPESKRGFPTPWASFCKLTGLSSTFPNSRFFGQYNLRYLNENQIHKVPILAGAFMLVRRTVLEKVNGFDNSFFMYGEDIDLSYRLLQEGYDNYYLPEVIVHYKGESSYQEKGKYQDYFYGAMKIFFKKYYPYSGKFFSFAVTMGINTRKLLSSLLSKNRRVENDANIITLDTSQYSYKDIIEILDNNKQPNTEFRIHNTLTGMVIGTGFAEYQNNYVTRK